MQIKRWEVNGFLISDVPFIENLEILMSALPGCYLFSNYEGKWTLATPPKADTVADAAPAPVMVFTDANYTRLPETSHLSAQDRVNKVKSIIYNANKDFSNDETIFPSANSVLETQLLAEDGGIELQTDLRLPVTDNKYAAADISTKTILQSRRGNNVSHSDTEAMLLEPGDIIQLSSDTMGLPTTHRAVCLLYTSPSPRD